MTGRFFLTLLFFNASLASLTAHEIQVIHQDIEVKEISKVDEGLWKSVNGNDIYAGLDNGIYWFRIMLHNESRSVLSLPNSHITRAKLFHREFEIDPIRKVRYFAFDLDNSPKGSYFYLRVDCVKEAYIPIRIYTQEEFRNEVSTNTLIIGLYNGFAMAVIVFNLFAFFNSGNRTYFYYVLMLISISLGLLYKDGTSNLVISNTDINEVAEKIYNLMLAVSCIFLSHSYLQLDKYLPKARWYGVYLLGICLIIYIIFLITRNFYAFIAVNISILSLLTFYLGTGIYLFNKNIYSKFFSIAYGLITILSYDYYLSPLFGYYILDLPLNQFRIGGVFEMLVFSYAIMYQSKVLTEENSQMRAELFEYAQVFKNASREGDKNSVISHLLLTRYELTVQEIKVLQGIADGKGNKEIADELNLSVNTVKFHIRNIYRKMEINSRKEASLKYFEGVN